MITYGLHLTQSHDQLQKISIELVAAKVKHPKAEFKARIEQLRRINVLDPKQYRKLKTGLPYFCCSIFNPPHRKKENFASISAFTLDLDHFSDTDLSRKAVADILSQDPHLRLLFTSPSGDGLKALFELAEPCSDPGKYSHFYKAFAQIFVNKYGLSKVIDWVTHDVTRATFFSADENAYVNNNATPVRMQDYISDEIGSEFFKTEKEFKKAARENTLEDSGRKKQDLAADTLTRIKKKLNPDYKPRKKKEPYVPDELTEALPTIETALAEKEMKIVDIKSINYGKQLKVEMEGYWAEINVFYGSRGFSVVRTTKTGSNEDLAELAYQTIDTFLNA